MTVINPYNIYLQTSENSQSDGRILSPLGRINTRLFFGMPVQCTRIICIVGITRAYTVDCFGYRVMRCNILLDCSGCHYILTSSIRNWAVRRDNVTRARIEVELRVTNCGPPRDLR